MELVLNAGLVAMAVAAAAASLLALDASRVLSLRAVRSRRYNVDVPATRRP